MCFTSITGKGARNRKGLHRAPDVSSGPEQTFLLSSEVQQGATSVVHFAFLLCVLRVGKRGQTQGRRLLWAVEIHVRKKYYIVASYCKAVFIIVVITRHDSGINTPWVCMYYMFLPIAAFISYTELLQSPFFVSAIPPCTGQCLHIGSALFGYFVYVMLFCYEIYIKYLILKF
jgi:hypothetical protein